jgi:hypothetical protein
MDPKLTAGFIEAKVETSKQQIAKAFINCLRLGSFAPQRAELCVRFHSILRRTLASYLGFINKELTILSFVRLRCLSIHSKLTDYAIYPEA